VDHADGAALAEAMSDCQGISSKALLLWSYGVGECYGDALTKRCGMSLRTLQRQEGDKGKVGLSSSKAPCVALWPSY